MSSDVKLVPYRRLGNVKGVPDNNIYFFEKGSTNKGYIPLSIVYFIEHVDSDDAGNAPEHYHGKVNNNDSDSSEQFTYFKFVNDEIGELFNQHKIESFSPVQAAVTSLCCLQHLNDDRIKLEKYSEPVKAAVEPPKPTKKQKESINEGVVQ